MGKKPKILVAGSYVMDLIATTRQVPKSGQTVKGTDFHTAPGGKGANQAAQCAKLGAEVTMIGCVGGDLFARFLLDASQEAGVDISHVKVDSSVSSGIGHILLEVSDTGAQNRITVIPGANQSLTVEDVAWVKDEISQYDFVMLQMEIPTQVNEAIADWARAAGVPVMLNPAPAGPLSDALLKNVAYLTPNEQEAATETGLPLRLDTNGPREDDMQAVACALRAKGVQNVIVTLGSHGSAVVEPDAVRYIPIVCMPKVEDPTAAGDSFVGALCVGLCAGLSREQALIFASYTAAITVSRMGAMPSLPTLAEVQTLLTQRGETRVDLKKLHCLF